MMPIIRSPRKMGDGKDHDGFRFVRINQSVRESFQRPFARAEFVRRAELRIPADEILRLRQRGLESFAQAGLMQFIPLDGLDEFKPRVGMMLDGL